VYVRLMRDEGYNFYRQDVYCENIFAKSFDVEDLKEKKFFGNLQLGIFRSHLGKIYTFFHWEWG